VDWAARRDARVWAIDPEPQEELVRLGEARDELELVCDTSFGALPRLDAADAVIVDGDHNYYTVSRELRLIADRAPLSELPLLLFHDVCWPHGRRDDYFAPDQIPDEHRHPLTGDDGIFPGEPGSRPGGLPYHRSAAREGGPRNGVLTAVEDFVAERDDLRLAVVPIFFGMAAVWHRDAPWAAEVARVIDPFDRNPVLERLEANRVFHVTSAYNRLMQVALLEERKADQERVLRRLLESSAFSVAERLSRLRRRAGVATGQPTVSKDEIRRVLAD
jgi:hypothetical protein